MTTKFRQHAKGRFPNFRPYRTECGLEISDVMARLPNGHPKESSIRRLDSGQAIRLVNVHRIFDVINTAKGGILDRRTEIEIIT